MHFMTDFGDQGVILPLTLCIAVVLASQGWWRGLATWLLVAFGMLGIMLVLKLAGLAWADTRGGMMLSPSGHVASTCALYGGLAMMLLRRKLSIPLSLVAPALIAVLIGYTRIALHAHDLAEVVIGGVVGIVGAALLATLAGPPPRHLFVPLLAATVSTMLVFHGQHLPVERMIRSALAGF